MINLTHSQGLTYLHDIADACNALAVALAAIAQLSRNTPSAPPPEALCTTLIGCWETLDNRFGEVYFQVHGSHAQDDYSTDVKAGSAEARLGQKELQ